MYRLPRKNSGSRTLYRSCLVCYNRAFAVDWLTQGIDNSAQHILTYRYLYYCACRFNNVSFLDFSVGTENYSTDIVFLKVQSHSVSIIRELQQFSGHAVLKAIYSGNTITYFDNGTKVRYLHLILVILDLFLDDCTDFFRSEIHYLPPSNII